LDGFVAIGMLRNRDGLAEDTMLSYIHRAYEPLRSAQPYTYTREWAAAQMADILDLKLSADERNIVRHVDLPPDQVFVLRITAGLNSVLAGLEATINWDDLGRELGLW